RDRRALLRRRDEGADEADAAGARNGRDWPSDRRCAQRGRPGLRDFRPSRARRPRLHVSAAQDARPVIAGVTPALSGSEPAPSSLGISLVMWTYAPERPLSV